MAVSEILAIASEQRLAIAGCLLAVWLVRKVLQYYRLRHFKGPFGSGVSGIEHAKAMMGTRCHLWYQSVSAKYGSIARIGPNELLVGDADIWAHVNVKPGYSRSEWWYRSVRFEHRRDTCFSMTDNERHDLRRKQIGPGYSGRETENIEGAVDEYVNKLLALIREKYISSPSSGVLVPMDLAKKIQFFTLDVISAVGLGRSFSMLINDGDVDDYLKSSEEGIRISVYLLAFGIGWLPQLPWLGKFLAPAPGDNNGFGRMMKDAFDTIDARAARPIEARSDMLASFMRHGLSGDELRSEGLLQIIAGSDTTAGSLRGIMLLILTHPRVYAKLQREIDEAVAAGKAPTAQVISMAQGKALPYLQAVIREGLRLFPAAMGTLPRDVPPEGDTVVVDGKEVFLPGGTSLGYCAYAIHRDKRTYGEDANAFRPERWLLEKDPDKMTAMLNVNDLVFGHGRWKCLGKPVAQIELTKVIFELMRNFDWGLLNPGKPWKADDVGGLWIISDMWVQVSPRG